MARPPDPHAQAPLEPLLEEAEEAFERQEFGRALMASEQVLEKSPRHPVALHYRAASLAAAGGLEEAEQAYREALAAAPDDLPILKGCAELLVLELGEEREAIEEALPLLKRGMRLAQKRKELDWQVEFTLLAAIALNKLGEPDRALDLLDDARELAPDDPEVALERGVALFELCRFEEARGELERALSLEPNEGWAHHYIALIAERGGEKGAARRHFAEARRHCPEDFPAPVELSPQAFDKAIADALARLPERVRRYLDNVSIAVQDLPREDDLLSAAPPLSPAILGLFHGTPITEKSNSDPWSYFPSSIVLYQKNLQRFARTREELIEQIGITLIHEVGHFLGLSEEDLYQRGLE